MAKVRAHLTIEGIVQGVFFRAHTKEQADRNSINGWVKNKPDGTVEALFEGEEASVKKLIEWCHHGPTGAAVKKVGVVWHEYKDEFKNFTVIRGV
ncbi:MAG: acylphosphatase [Deltaproteobacteria bacterium RIFCSPLOWO2_12_FULL_43_16]|nr:MAG: Acylphosphatase [Parcubacteria group bacterium GW2011_GWC2_45_7]OGQ10319.1 MAG: acylphosphatase [Deltaproteobacteria bacterium RIFCSPHIGHO2_02_FULL_43_33]OGQ59116.1 MAG: acylphosphatase [Deltaproteobacteria bacterium RIFCSPLOWO2_12_FULL_43_16]HBR15999.1 acylphosphatase [Deltaproteobacteria bacterium]